MSRLLSWVSMTHPARYHTAGTGHLYQDRSKSFPVQVDEHFLVLCRYFERNAVATGLVTAAQAWRLGSFCDYAGGRCDAALAAWPMPWLSGWIDRVSQPLGENEEEQLRAAIRRGHSLKMRGGSNSPHVSTTGIRPAKPW